MHIESNFDIYVGVCAATGRYARCLQLNNTIITRSGIDRNNHLREITGRRRVNNDTCTVDKGTCAERC